MKKLLYIGNKLSKHGYNKTSIETLGVFLANDGYEVKYSSDKKNKLIRILDMIFAVFLNKKKVDYILIDTYSTSSFWYAFYCSQMARFLSIKYIPILRGGNLPSRLKKNPFLSKLIFKHAYKNVVPSSYLKSEFEKYGFKNIIYIPNSIEIDKYSFKKRLDFKPKLLWVRAFASIYNPLMSVEVLSKLTKKYPNASLTMIGPDKDGSLHITKERANQLGVSVNFTGQLSKEVWWQLSTEHDVFINTTHFDNTPVSVIEAMALGLPVVSTNVGGIPYLLRNNETAFLIDDNDISAMVNAIEKITINPDESIIMVNKARVFVESMDWKMVKQKWISLLK